MTIASYSVPVGKHAHSIVRSTEHLNLWHGSVRSAKTITSLFRWLTYIDEEAPPGDLYMIGKTERTLERNVLNPLKDLLGHRAVKHNRGLGELQILGRRHYIVGASDERAEQKLRGPTAAGVYGDEVSTWPESAWKMALSRLSLEGAKLFGTTNPDAPRHWLKKGLIDRAREPDMSVGVFHFTLDDNPHVPESFKRALKAEYVPGTLWYRRFIEGLWVAAAGAIYDMWQPSRHLIAGRPEPDAIARAWVACDYGTASVTTALLFLEVLRPFPHVFVAREWRHDAREPGNASLTDSEVSAQLRDWVNHELSILLERRASTDDLSWAIVDPSASSLITQLRRDRWVRVRYAENDVIDGIRSVASLLAAGRVGVHESCEYLTDEMEGYVWDEKAQAAGEDKPVKEDDHGPDTFRYGIATPGPASIWREWVSTAPLLTAA